MYVLIIMNVLGFIFKYNRLVHKSNNSYYFELFMYSDIIINMLPYFNDLVFLINNHFSKTIHINIYVNTFLI